VLIAELDDDGHAPGDDLFWNDSWDGYPAARTRITKFLQKERIRNPVVITGDWRSTFANDVKADYEDPATASATPTRAGPDAAHLRGRVRPAGHRAGLDPMEMGSVRGRR
jgi:phosphodiesterase/alkaline phosphatase D-like protein